MLNSIHKTLIVLMGLFLIFQNEPVFADESNAAVYNFDGKASMRRENTVYQLDYDMPCRMNDIIRSDKDGFIDITMKKFAAFRMVGATECLLKKIETDERIIQLNYGTVQINLKPLSSNGSLTIETPIVIASVNGSQFTPEPKNNIFMVIHVKSKNKSTPVTFLVTKQGGLNVQVKESHTSIKMLETQALEVAEGAFAPVARNATEEELQPLEKANGIYITED